MFTGYVGDRVAGTVSFIHDGDVAVVIDPGMVPEAAAILGPLGELVAEIAERTVVRQQFGSQKLKRSRSTGAPHAS